MSYYHLSSEERYVISYLVLDDLSLREIGRRIGQAQVVDTPNWGQMTPADFEAFIKNILSGEKLYLYGDQD